MELACDRISMILSIDLASVRYRDNGIAILAPGARACEVELISPGALGLSGVPVAEEFADAIVQLATRSAARLIMLDGPQGWRSQVSEVTHSRLCERVTFTPGKSGVPELVKPASWTRMVRFSVAVFDALDRKGWPRLAAGWQGERAAVESFPTHAWRALGHPPLPGKSRRVDLAHWRRLLTPRYVNGGHENATHDELQVVVAGLGGCQMLGSGLESCVVAGRAPVIEGGTWREGFIVSPSSAVRG